MEWEESFSSITEIRMYSFLDHPYENMRYQISHKLSEQQEKDSLQRDFLHFELIVWKIMLLLHLEQPHQRE